MRLTKIITAKIKPSIYNDISSRKKLYEVRSESFEGATLIRYVSSMSMNLLGFWEIGPEQEFDRDSDEFVRSLAGVSREDFEELFPRPSTILPGLRRQVNYLYAAHIGKPVLDINEYIDLESERES